VCSATRSTTSSTREPDAAADQRPQLEAPSTTVDAGDAGSGRGRHADREARVEVVEYLFVALLQPGGHRACHDHRWVEQDCADRVVGHPNPVSQSSS
jgi:hypothetical protein